MSLLLTEDAMKLAKLSDREKQCLDILATGALNKEIAYALEITEATAKNHLKSIYDKIGVNNRLQAFLWYQRAKPILNPVGYDPEESFQSGVDRWLIACFGREIARDRTERNHRFLEEALETVQAGNCTRSEAHQLVDYVFDRPVGELYQEVGGVMNTLAALCLAYGLDMNDCGNREMARVWTKVEQIRAKQAAKPKHSPLPEHVK